jgi:hypothetical protein
VSDEEETFQTGANTARQGRNQILDFSPARRGIGFWIEEKEAHIQPITRSRHSFN